MKLVSGNEYIRRAYNNTQGYISRMYIDNKKYGTYTYHYTMDNLAKMPVIDEENLYISQNTFFRPERNKDSLKRLNMLFIDLDCYKIGLRKEAAFELLCDEYFGRKIPTPTYIIDSGRGLYLLWSINEDRNAFPRWKRVQHYLHNTLKELGSDGSVTEDVSRVLRAPGSINSKSGTRVEVLREMNYTYTLYEIIKEYLPEGQENNAVNKKYKGKIINFASLNTLFYARIKDIEKLLSLRGRSGNIYLRENCLFIYRYCCCHYYNDTSKALEMTLELFRSLSNQKGYTEKDIIRRTKSGETYYLKKNRKFTNKKIIDLLDITEEEQKHLKTLISKEIVQKRKSERNKMAYKRKLKEAGKNTKDDDIKARRKQIKELLEVKTSIEIICKRIGISKATFYRDLEVIKKESDSHFRDKKNNIEKKPTKKPCRYLHIKQSVKRCINLIKKFLSQKFSLCITKDVVLSTKRYYYLGKKQSVLLKFFSGYISGP